ncbi:conserved unknown protein [Ectocarpus siliculosus]|uniref:Anaphase-promoting complex subunit 4 WD40 domain-containing protein n=1 Tax=Ectocarpus siliculosus TaxID=2880 RepID=D8LDM7_ECTSI|nr:conserved unknown protein [Ectocarpus siliculosus]|eukprot:CBN78434.1 conserved unknown protein [Ectocarpus siliculosus]
MSAHFSSMYDQSSGLVQWSPDGRYVAMAVGKRLMVRDAMDGFEIVQGGLRPCLDKIEALEWASDSDLLLCAMYKRSLVEVMSVARPDWQCRIREGLAGMVKALWAPDARHVVTFSDFSLHMSVWSLSTRQLHTVRQPKAAPGCIAFSPDALIMAVATRRDCRDHLKLYDTRSWESLGEFTAETVDLTHVDFSPDGFTLCLQDTSLDYRVMFYSLAGKLVGRLEAYSHALGVKSMAWSPDGTLLSVGSYDQCARLVSPVTWKAVAVLRHVHPKTQDVDITYAPALTGPIPSERPDPSKPHPRLGVGQIMSWSVDGRYLATRNDNMASALWVWDTEDLSLSSVVVQPGFEKVACYREVPLGQEQDYEEEEDGNDNNKENGAAENNRLRAPSNASSLSLVMQSRAGGGGAGTKGVKGGRRTGPESTLKPKMQSEEELTWAAWLARAIICG